MFDLKFGKRDYGLITLAIGIGIFLGIIMPAWGWMISCGTALVAVGIFYVKKYY